MSTTALSVSLFFFIQFVFKNRFLQKAIELVGRATEEDRGGQYTTALKFYEQACDYFMHAIKCMSFFKIRKWLSRLLDESHGDKQKQAIRSKVGDYLDRAEQIKKFLKEGATKKPVKDGKDDSDEDDDKKKFQVGIFSVSIRKIE